MSDVGADEYDDECAAGPSGVNSLDTGADEYDDDDCADGDASGANGVDTGADE